MPKTITALEFQKRDPQRIRIFLNGRYAFSLDAATAGRLRVGDPIEHSEINRLTHLDETRRSYQRALFFLGHRPRTIAETRRFLSGKGFSPEAAENAIARLIDQRYLDDTVYARLWIENRQRLRPRSVWALRFELRAKGIAEGIIDTLLADVDDDQAAWTALRGRRNRWHHLPDQVFRQKVTGFLRSRGFSYETVNRAYHRARDRSRPTSPIDEPVDS